MTTSLKSILMAGAFSVLAGVASAATLSITDVESSGNIPDAGQTNEVLEALQDLGLLPGDDTLAVDFGATIVLEGTDGQPAKILAEYYGYEAGFLNSFAMGGGSFTTGAPDELIPTMSMAFDTFIDTQGPGALEFEFETQGGMSSGIMVPGATVTNAANPDVDSGLINFAAFQDREGGVWLFFDDTGRDVDDNHDDFVVRLSIDSVVPVPGAIIPMLTVLGGFGVMRARRRKQANA